MRHTVSLSGDRTSAQLCADPVVCPAAAHAACDSAFTATATERVRKDILDSLKLEDPYEAVTGFDRENLYFEVQNVKDKDKPARILEYLEKHREDSGIIYCATRKAVDELYLYLDNADFPQGATMREWKLRGENGARKILFMTG